MKKLLLHFLVIACLAMSSCSRYYYKPNSVNAPLLANSQDLHLSANAATDGAFVNVQGAYSPINHLGIIGGFSTYSFKADNPDPATGNVDAKAHLGEIGAGYYYAPKKKVTIICDIYGGVGFGSMTSDVNMTGTRLFVQPGVGMRTPWFDCSFNLRMCDLKYNNLNTNGHDDAYMYEHHLIDNTGARIDSKHYVFAEPAITLRGGYKFIKVQAQYVVASAISTVPWEYNNNSFTLGLNFQLEDLLNVSNGKKH